MLSGPAVPPLCCERAGVSYEAPHERDAYSGQEPGDNHHINRDLSFPKELEGLNQGVLVFLRKDDNKQKRCKAEEQEEKGPKGHAFRSWMRRLVGCAAILSEGGR